MFNLLNKKLFVFLVILIVLSSSVFAAFSKESWYMDPASADQVFYDCGALDANPNKNNFNCHYTTCTIDEGKTYWLCTEDKPSSCDDNGQLGSCFYQLDYLGTPPPSLQLLDMIWDGTYIKAKVMIGQTTTDNLVVKAVYDRWAPFGQISSAFDPIGYFTVRNVLTEKHGCYAIDMSGESGYCNNVLQANDNMKGWHWIDYSLGIGKGSSMLGANVRADNSLWSNNRLSVGNNLTNPDIIINKSSAVISVNYFNQTDNLVVQGSLVDKSTGVVVVDDDITVNGGLTVFGISNLGSVPFLNNEYQAITINGTPIIFTGILNSTELTAFTAEVTDLSTKNLELDGNFNVRQNFVSDVNIKASKFMGAVAFGSDCFKSNGDGGLSVSFGCT